MKQIQFALARGVAILGLPGILGLGLLVFVAAFSFSTLRSEQMRLDNLRQQAAKAREQRAAQADAPAGPITPADRLAAFYGFFPQPAALPDLLQKVFVAAKGQGLQLEHGEYRVLADNAGGLTQFQVTLPLHGSYPQIRKFLDEAMAQIPALSLDSIQFDRQKVGDATVDANVKLALFLGKKS